MNGREFKEQHQKELDNKFFTKYPNGRFSIGYWVDDNNTIKNGVCSLYRIKDRPTSGGVRISKTDLGVRYDILTGEFIMGCLTLSFGHLYYDSFEKMINAAKKKKFFPQIVIDKFTEIYKDPNYKFSLK